MNSTPRRKSAAATALYLTLAFLSAFELFLIQPMLAKYILPWFGGAASVWTACLLFFQAALFIGYLYAWLISFASVRIQVFTHIALVALSACAIAAQYIFWHTPLLPPHSITTGTLGNHPTLAVLVILSVSAALPYTMLASTSPLVQSWFYGKPDDSKKPIYFFYAVSNAGSLLALLLYPILVEPLLSLHSQAILWSAGYIAFALTCSASAIHAARSSNNNTQTAETTHDKSSETTATSPAMPLIWLALSASATLLLISFTNQICADVAPVPLLWILPLAIYLLAFILSFSSHAEKIPAIAAIATLPAVAAIIFITKHSLQIGIIPQLAVYFTTLFITCMLSLGLLHKLRPPPKQLTFFYLMIALGGALGGIFVGIIAPVIFNDYWEMRIALMISCAIALLILQNARWASSWRIPLYITTFVLVALLSRMPQSKKLVTVEKSRGFYGTLKVLKESQPHGINVYSLMHGKICHGLQFDSGRFSRIPSAYFGPQSGIGVAFASHPKRTPEANTNQTMRVGILGMGIGTVAAYGQPGDNFRFYELSPDVVRMATDTRHFRYLHNCPAKVDIILGDARLSLERELRENGPLKFDILNMDAFNGDAIPVHLLTLEAFKTYLAHLNPDHGILAIQITNMYLDLIPVVAGIAEHYHLRGYIVRGHGDMRLTSDCLWILLSPTPDFTINNTSGADISPLDTTANTILWTDDFSNIISIMKRKLFVKERSKR